MKKLMALILILCLIPLRAMGCEVLLPRAEEPAPGQADVYTPVVFTGCSSWAVVSSCRELAGIMSPDEPLDTLPVQTVSGDYIRGFAQAGGLIRVKTTVGLMRSAEAVIGLKAQNNVSIIILGEHLGTVAEITERRIGTEPSAASIAAATLWIRGDQAAHIFWLQEANVFAVGQAVFNGGANSAILWAGDFDGDGYLELGFKFGVPFPSAPKPTEEPEPEATPEPEPEATPAPTAKPKPKPQATPEPCKPCEPAKVCFEIDLRVIVKGCVTLLKKVCGQ